jgi:hypothetical protein
MNFDVNYLAILVSGIVFMIVGTLWYGPFFGKSWMKLINMTPESMKGSSKGSMARSMILVFIVALVTSFVLAVLLKTLLITTISGAIMLAFLLWLGFVATTMLHRVLFEKSSMNLYAINASQSLVAMLLGSLVLVAWPW